MAPRVAVAALATFLVAAGCDSEGATKHGGAGTPATAEATRAAPMRELTYNRACPGGHDHLYAVPAQGGGGKPRRVDRLRGSVQDPDWSPDGRRVAVRFLADADEDRGDRIRVMDTDGSRVVDLSRRSGVFGSSPSWSADGRLLVVSGRRRGEQHVGIYVMTARGTRARRLTPPELEAQYPAWSPDGRRIAFTYVKDGGFDVHAINADGTGDRAVAASPAPENWPVWSPDSKRIAYGVERPEGSTVEIVNADGTGRRQLFGPERRAGVPMAWEPGALIAVNCSGAADEQIGVCVVRPDGGGFRRMIEEGGFPAWRP